VSAFFHFPPVGPGARASLDWNRKMFGSRSPVACGISGTWVCTADFAPTHSPPSSLKLGRNRSGKQKGAPALTEARGCEPYPCTYQVVAVGSVEGLFLLFSGGGGSRHFEAFLLLFPPLPVRVSSSRGSLDFSAWKFCHGKKKPMV
jgi:hypothetical protein